MHPNSVSKAHVNARRCLVNVPAAKRNEIGRELPSSHFAKSEFRSQLDSAALICPHLAGRFNKEIGDRLVGN